MRAQIGDGRAEDVTALLEIGELVEGGAGGRGQDAVRGQPRWRGSGGGGANRGIERAGDLIERLAAERRGESLRGIADQVGLADAREEGRQAFDAAVFRLAAGDPEDVGG